MAHHPTANDPIPFHIESLSFIIGALAHSPGNQLLAGPVVQARAGLYAVQQGQNGAGDKTEELHGAECVVLFLFSPVIKELEKLEKGFLASPAGKGWTPLFEKSASTLLTRSTLAEKAAALANIDAAVTRTNVPAIFKDAGKRFHQTFLEYQAIRAEETKNEAQQGTIRTSAAEAKDVSEKVSRQTEGKLQGGGASAAFKDAHFKPFVSSRKNKAEDPKTIEELKTANQALTEKLAAIQAANEKLTAERTELESQVKVISQQLADFQAHLAMLGGPPSPAAA